MRKLLFILLVMAVKGCVKDRNFESISNDCQENLYANATFSQIKELYQGELIQIKEDLIIEGYVISSDRAGNFFSVLHFQDSPSNPIDGFQIEIDLFESHLLFEPGSKVLIRTKGLYLEESRGVFKLGGTFAGFGTVSVGRLPALKIPEHIFRTCDELLPIVPTEVTIDNLDSTMVNTLIQINNLEVVGEELGMSFAKVREETKRTLKDCFGNQISLLNSGFADFQSELLPEGNGVIRGVLLPNNDNFSLSIRDLTDVNFPNERCTDLRQTSTKLIFSELADPNNNIGARFIELYNSSEDSINLEGWAINRYTNDNLEISTTIDLTGFYISPLSTFVISPNVNEFERIYGFSPDLSVGINSPADSNGDDNLELVDPFGTVIDIFGVLGEDGTGTDHEFEDGRAMRKLSITCGNVDYTFSEWKIFNDSGVAGTVNEPQNAPEDFDPGIRQ